MSQPPLSDSIRQLEEELGTQLLNRTRRSVELTESGVVFLDRARRILIQLSEAVDFTQGIAHGMHEHIAVGFNSASSYEILPGIVRRFRTHYPNTSLGLTELGTAEREDALLQRRVDVVLYNVPTISRPGIRQEAVLREPLVAVLPADHPLAGEAEVNLRRLSNETFLVRPSRQETGHRALVLYACRWAGFVPNDVREVDRLHNAVSLIASGFGVTLVPASLGRFAPPGAAYVRIMDPSSELYMDCGVSCRSDDNSVLTKRFIDVAREFGREFMQANT